MASDAAMVGDTEGRVGGTEPDRVRFFDSPLSKRLFVPKADRG